MAGCKLIVEDQVGLAILEKLVQEFRPDLQPTIADGLEGIQFIRQRMRAYKAASRSIPHIFLVDLDETPCAAELLAKWKVKNSASNFRFRVAVREGEAWLLADRNAFASFFHVPLTLLPKNPEALPDPKSEVLKLGRRSRLRAIQEDLRPIGSARKGPNYNSTLVRFTQESWSPERASANSESLARAIQRLREM